MNTGGILPKREEAQRFGLDFHTRVEEISHKKYASLPKKGKPESGEWTPLATVVQATYSGASYGTGHVAHFKTQGDRRSAFFFRNGSGCPGYWLKVHWTTKNVTRR